MMLGQRFRMRPLVAIFVIAIAGHQISYITEASTVDRCRQNMTDTRLVDNGYEGLVVWLGSKVLEDYNLIRDLQDLLTATSEMMFNVTRRRAYIRKVSVFLPRSWGKPPVELEDIMQAHQDKVHSSQSRGDFLIKNHSPRSADEPVSWRLGDENAYVDRPYVIKPTPCGYSGQYLRMSPEFVRFGKRAADELGNPEKLMVREWAKLRWGVYDELPLADQPNFYPHTDLGVHPVACSLAVKGKIINSAKPDESCAPKDALEDTKCQFEPERSEDNADTLNGKQYGSLMYKSDLSHINHFCDTEEESGEAVPFEQQHNTEAPTLHNLHCQSQSVWEVMRNHPDFLNNENPPLPEDFVPPPPEFTLLQVPDRRIVLVLDTSTSMTLFNRMKLMRQAASQFIETVPMNSWLGIVTFSAEATVKSELLEISKNDVRNHLKRRLPTVLVTGTSIGSGLLAALKVLKNSGPKHMRTSGGTLLVLTDGKEHNSPKINETMQDVIDFGVQVNTIAFGPKVTSDLEHLADVTGGSTYFASSGDFSSDSELREAFLATIENDEDDVVAISSNAVKIPANGSVEHTFTIDETIGVQTRITILYTDSVPPTVGLENPLGDSLWETEEFVFGMTNVTAEFFSDADFSTKSIQYYGEMMPGTWKILLENERVLDSVTVQISILSHPKEASEAISLSPALLCRIIDYTGIETIVIYAYLSRGEAAVLDAFVGAEVTRPLSRAGMVDTARVQLRDDGLGADVIANDGIYSGYFTDFTLQGRYNVKVFANNAGGRARTEDNYILGIGYKADNLAIVSTRDLLDAPKEEEDEAKSRTRRAAKPGFLPSFERSSSGAGAFTVNDWVADVCPDGYNHFQDSCYKFQRNPMLSYSEASSLCEREGGYLANVDSNQELKYLLDVVQFWETWFGGVNKEFLESEDFSVEYVADRPRRGSEDEDLAALAEIFKQGTLNKDLQNTIATFEPDIEGLDGQELNAFLRTFGLQTVSDLEVIKEKKLLNQQDDKKANLGVRKRRQAEIDALLGPTTDSYPTTQPVTIAAAGNQTEFFTLSLAKKEPEKKEFENSGEPDPTCSWFQDSSIIETSGEICDRKKMFICERPKLDLLPPSRITDLYAKLDNNLGIITVQWSAPGDDFTEGSATSYVLRTLRTRRAKTRLMKNFDEGEILSQSSLMIGTLENPKLAGKQERLLVNLTKISGCPPHGAIDLIVVLPRRFFDRKSLLQSQRDAGIELFKSLFSIFKISQYEVQVSIVAVQEQTGFVILRDGNNARDAIRALEAGLENENVRGRQRQEGAIEQIIQNLIREGRVGVSKVVLSLIDEEELGSTKKLKVETDSTSIAIGIAIGDKGTELRTLVSEPACRNAIIVESWQDLNSTVESVVSQLCYARQTEYQAIGVIAIDDQGLKGPPSNIIPFIIENEREPVICPPEPTAPILPMVAGNTAMTVGLAIGVPVAVILSIVGAVILFGQLRKYRKKQRERKERKELEAKQAAAESARAERAAGSSGLRGNMRALLQNPNLKLKMNKTSPVTQPPV